MDNIELVKDVKEIPENFDITLITEMVEISLPITDWIYISFLCNRADTFRPHENPEVVDGLKEGVTDAIIESYNRYAIRNNYAKEMVDKGLWPDHSKTMQESESNVSDIS